jgi:intein/homing endonuclease
VLYQQVERQIQETGNSHILAFRLATWDINPKFMKLGENHPEIQQEYRTRGIEAKRDYAGIRPGTEESFFNRHLVQAQAKYDLPIASRAFERVVEGVDGTTRRYSAIQIIKKEPKEIIVPSPFFSYGHCDPGLKHDSFGLVAGHPEIDPNTGLVIANISTVLEWRPVDKGRGLIYPVDYENVESQILELAKLITLKRLSFDHWNCYAVGSLIATPEGLRKVEDLVLGDPVVGKENINHVVARKQVTNQAVVRVKTKFGYEATVTPHHPFWVVGHGWKYAEELASGDKIQLDAGRDIFGDKHDPLKALVYGYLVAEGDWSEASNSVRFSNTEPEVIHDFASTFEAVFNVKPTENKLGVRCGYDHVRHQIASELATGAFNKHVPQFVLEGTEQTVGHFLAGLYEGDGNVRLNPKVLSVELNTVSKQLSEEVHLLLLRLGIKSSRKYFDNKYFNNKQRPFYRITIYGENIKTFLMKVGFRSNRKRIALNQAVEMISGTRRSRSKDMHTAVVSVEPTVADIVHLEVSGDHSYVGQGLVGHNSAMIIQRLYSAGISTSEFKSSFSQPVQREIYEITREWMTNGRIKLPKRSESPAAEKLHKELEELVLLKGRRIDHPKKGSKDLSDGLACVIWAISQDERRYRYFETGSNKIRTSGSINVASALPDLFDDGNTMAQRSEQLRNMPKNINPKNATVNRVRVTRNDWYGPGYPPDQR